MITVREALERDLHGMKDVVKRAFYREGKDERFNEWEFVENVTGDQGFVRALCLVAEKDAQIVGYLLLSEARIGQHEGLSLGPLAVDPGSQKAGIGKRLVWQGLERAKALGYGWVALTGGDYYQQFGFEPALPRGIILAEGHPENEYLKILFLAPDPEDRVCGVMRFCDAFYDEAGQLL